MTCLRNHSDRCVEWDDGGPCDASMLPCAECTSRPYDQELVERSERLGAALPTGDYAVCVGDTYGRIVANGPAQAFTWTWEDVHRMARRRRRTPLYWLRRLSGRLVP